MKIISWNVNGLRALHKKGQFDWLLKESPDIFVLQETKSLPEQLPDEVRNPTDYHSYFHFPTVKKGYSGVAIYSKIEPVQVTLDLGIKDMDQEGRVIMAEFSDLPHGQEDFVLINTYFPNGGGAPERLEYKLAFYEHYLSFIENLRKRTDRIIFCGDVNVAHKEIDLARPKENSDHVGFLPIERAWMDKLISKGWVDVYRHFYPTQSQAYTYWDMKSYARERNVGWRIDYFFTTPEMLRDIKSIKILNDVFGSDHCPVEVVLKTK